jgi:DNA-binding GntR family transcriptional regulator
MRIPGEMAQGSYRREARPEDNEAFGEPIGLTPIRAGGLGDEVAKQLFAAIVAGRVGLGERLSEAAIARELGISRGPIREAQRLLERRGLLVFKPRRGFFLREMTPEQIADLFGLRRVLERYAI